MEYKESQDESESAATSDESEEESEIDEEQTESRRVECMTTIKDLEIQFQKLKEELIEEKLRVVETKLQEIETETAREFQMPVNKLKENMNLRLSVSNLLKDYRLANIENMYMCDETSARQSVENDKAMLFDSIKSKIENEIREIEENRRLLYLDLKKKEDYYEAMGSWTQFNNSSNATINNNNNSNTGGQPPMANQNQQAISKSQTSPYKRKSQQKFPTTDDFDRKKKTTTVSGPYIVYSVPEWDMLEDWSIIKRAFDKNKPFEDQNNFD